VEDFETPLSIANTVPYQTLVKYDARTGDDVYVGCRTFPGIAYLLRYKISTATWTTVYSQGFTHNLTHVVDVVPIGTLTAVAFAVGTLNDYGESFNEVLAQDAWSGLWQYPGFGAASQVNTGPQQHYASGNINHPNTINGLASALISGSAYVWATHAWTVPPPGLHSSILSATIGPIAFTDIEWAFIDATNFAYWTLMPIQYHGEWPVPGLWFVGDYSGTGAYSFPSDTEIITTDIATYTPTVVNGSVRSGACGGLFFSNSDKGILFDTNGVEHVWQLTGRGAVVTQRIPSTAALLSTRWGFAIHPTFPYAVLSYSGNAGADGKIVWTEDEGDTFSEFITVSRCIDAIDFGVAMAPPPPPMPGPWPTVITLRDSRGFTGRATFYVFADDAATARTRSLAVAGDIVALSEAFLDASTGAYTKEPQVPIRGAQSDYEPIEQHVILSFNDASGNMLSVEVPSPTSAIMTNAGDYLDLTNPGLTTAVADMIAQHLCGRGGNEAVNFVGGRRVSSRIRRKGSVWVLNPAETGPGL
jgi:hypothetical protein